MSPNLPNCFGKKDINPLETFLAPLNALPTVASNIDLALPPVSLSTALIIQDPLKPAKTFLRPSPTAWPISLIISWVYLSNGPTPAAIGLKISFFMKSFISIAKSFAKSANGSTTFFLRVPTKPPTRLPLYIFWPNIKRLNVSELVTILAVVPSIVEPIRPNGPNAIAAAVPIAALGNIFFK